MGKAESRNEKLYRSRYLPALITVTGYAWEGKVRPVRRVDPVVIYTFKFQYVITKSLKEMGSIFFVKYRLVLLMLLWEGSWKYPPWMVVSN